MAFDIQRYMTRGVVRVVTDSLRATAGNDRERAFMKGFAKAARAAPKETTAQEAQEAREARATTHNLSVKPNFQIIYMLAKG